MDKEMILAKSREENKHGDELEKHSHLLAENTAVIATVLTTMFLLILAILRHQDIYPYLLLTFVGCTAEAGTLAVKKKSVICAIGAAVCLVLSVIFLTAVLKGDTFIVQMFWEEFFA
ncbi:MAG: DUF6442 family protein [Oscillospiraceae bacterium]|nr:DUF6442 family protein [Oscillospiraceae bacterium]